MKYIDAEKLKAKLDEAAKQLYPIITEEAKSDEWKIANREYNDMYIKLQDAFKAGAKWMAGRMKQEQSEQDRMWYCIEYINPQHPLLNNGELNIRHLRVPDEHGAEMAITLMLSFGAKIYALYRGNVKEGKLDEWPAPMIVDADDWYSVDWLHDILDCGCTL